MTSTLDLHTLLPWTEGKIIQTVRGPKMLRTAAPSPEFWTVWRANKQTLVAQGINPGKHYQTGEWEIKWWAEPPADYMETYNRNLAGSRAVDAQIDIPCPPGCELMPFQRAGVAFLLESLK